MASSVQPPRGENAAHAIPAGPIETEPVAAIPSMGPGAPRSSAQALHRTELIRALTGVELGAHDARIVNWIAGYEPSTVATICSWLLRVRAAGEAAR